MRLIAIDGPAGSGKSTVARAVAARLDLAYLDTGAMYRAVTWAALHKGIHSGDGPALARLAKALGIAMDEDRVVVYGVDVTQDIRGPDITQVVSTVAAHPEVRAEMVRRQRAWVEAHGGGVVEGRDIGSVVFPDADLKVFLTASDDERSRRRAREVGSDRTELVATELARRDRLDSTRAASPLTIASNALVIDTTSCTVDEVVEQILSRL